jgi:rare lipoprotein A
VNAADAGKGNFFLFYFRKLGFDAEVKKTVCLAIYRISVILHRLEREKPFLTSTGENYMVKATKLILLMFVGLAMIEFSAGQPLNAVASAAQRDKVTYAAAHKNAPRAKLAKSTKRSQKTSSMKGIAAIYADKFHGRKTSSGQRFSQHAMTAAHKTLPFGTTVRVTNLRNNKTVDVVVNDRGPWCRGRVIDLSTAAAGKIGMLRAGLAHVKLEIVSSTSST